MPDIPRTYTKILQDHFGNHRQMVFLSGPRQVGKTTLSEIFATTYFNWDYVRDRTILLRGDDTFAMSDYDTLLSEIFRFWKPKA